MLEVKDINVSYNKQTVLKNISIKFHPKVFYGIVGCNGAGKSTLLNAISRDLKLNSGEILLDGVSIQEYSQKEFAKKISYMRQNTDIKFPYTVRELVEMGRYCHTTVSKDENERIIDEKIEENDMGDYANKSLSELSGGEVQRAIFAKILAQDSDVILVDEGFSNADIFYKLKFMKQLKKEVENGKTVIMVIHDLLLARKFCDELIVLDKQGVYDSGKSNVVLNRHTLKDVFKVNGDFVNGTLLLE